MGERIRITTECDGLRSAHPDSEKLCRLGVGSRLPLLRDDDRHFFKVAVGGQPVFVPKSCGVRGRAVAGAEAIAVVVEPGVAAAPTAIAPSGPYPTAKAGPRRRRFATALRVVLLVVGVVLIVVGFALAMSAARSVLSYDSSLGTGIGLGVGGGVSAVVGLTLTRLTFRSLLQFALILTGLALLIGGIELLIFAIPFSRMSGTDIDPERASTAMPMAGGILATMGLAMVLTAFLRWLRNPQSRARWPDVARWSAILYGGLLALGAVGFAGSATVAAEEQAPTIQDAAGMGAAIPLSLLPGALLGYYGLTMTRRTEGRPFRFLPGAVVAGLFALAVGLGAVVVAVEEPLVWLMPAAHAGAALLPALALIALVSRGGLLLTPTVAGLTHRQLWFALAIGAVVVTLVAGMVDGFIAEALSMALLAHSGAFDGLHTFQDIVDVVADADLYLSRTQEILLLLAVVVVVAPIMEEGFKGLSVALVLPRQPTPAAALALGVAVGAGFGVFEASLYGLGGLAPEGEIDWWPLMLIRGGATSMHALNTGLLGLALYYDRSEGRFRRAFMLYLAAVALHGLWNGLAVLAGSRVIFSFEGLSDQALAWVVFAVMGALGIAVLGALCAVARRAYRLSPKVGDTEPSAQRAPLPTFEPWLG